MAQSNEIAAVYAAAVIQGVALVTFPAASTVFASSQYYGLSSIAYGGIFLPQATMAILAALLGARLVCRLGIKRIYLFGLGANLLSMALLFLSQFIVANHLMAYGMLLLATASLGIGFGLTVPALNTFTAVFFPRKIDSAVLILNALLGLGTVLAPVFVALFIGLGIWWGLPVLAGVLLLGLLLSSLGLFLEPWMQRSAAQTNQGETKVPWRFWVFAMFALLYGICETMNGNWASLYMIRNLGAATSQASMALAVFWGMVTAGRVLFAALEKKFSERSTYQLLPFVVLVAFVVVGLIPQSDPLLGILAFGLAGLGCSALLPLTISFGQKELTTITASVAGGLIAFYQVGYGVGAFGVGPLQSWAGLDLKVIYGWTALLALVMAGLSFIVAGQSGKENRLTVTKEKIS